MSSRGIIYLMSTIVDGLIKIGKTDSFENRMRTLERNGYRNITGLKREFAIEVDNYEEKELLLHNIFSKSRIDDSELFSVDIDLAKQLLSSFDGQIIYPRQNKTEIFTQATDAIEEKEFLNINRHHFKNFEFSTGPKKYYTRTNEKGTLSIFDFQTNLEIPNRSKPSKKDIVRDALTHLNIHFSKDETLYQLVRKLQKIICNK